MCVVAPQRGCPPPLGWENGLDYTAGVARTQALSFRVPVDCSDQLLRLRDTFAEQSWRAVFEWLLSQPEVCAVVAARLAQVRHPSVP